MNRQSEQENKRYPNNPDAEKIAEDFKKEAIQVRFDPKTEKMEVKLTFFCKRPPCW